MFKLLQKFPTTLHDKRNLTYPFSLICFALSVMNQVQARQLNDLMQMESKHAGKPVASVQDLPNSARQTAFSGSIDKMIEQAKLKYKAKQGDEVLADIEKQNAEIAKTLSPQSRRIVERYFQKSQSGENAAKIDNLPRSVEQVLQQLKMQHYGNVADKNKLAQNLELDQQRSARIIAKFFDPGLAQKNQRMQDDAHAYLMQNLAKEAEMRKATENTSTPVIQNRAAPLQRDAVPLHWMQKRMLTMSADQLSPKSLLTDQVKVADVRAQVEDYLKQLRSNKAGSISQRYGADARIVTDDELRALGGVARTGNKDAGKVLPGNTASKAATLEKDKPIPIPGF